MHRISTFHPAVLVLDLDVGHGERSVAMINAHGDNAPHMSTLNAVETHHSPDATHANKDYLDYPTARSSSTSTILPKKST